MGCYCPKTFERAKGKKEKWDVCSRKHVMQSIGLLITTVCVCACIHVRVYMCVCRWVFIGMCVKCVYICVNVCMYVCMYARVCLWVTQWTFGCCTCVPNSNLKVTVMNEVYIVSEATPSVFCSLPVNLFRCLVVLLSTWRAQSMAVLATVSQHLLLLHGSECLCVRMHTVRTYIFGYICLHITSIHTSPIHTLCVFMKMVF